MTPSRCHLLATVGLTLAASAPALAPASAEVLFEETFRGTGEQNQPEGFRKVGGFKETVVDLDSDNGAPLGYLDSNGEEFPTESSVIVDHRRRARTRRGVPLLPSARTKTGTRVPDYEGEFLYEAYLGDPEAGGTMLASGRAPGAEDGELQLDFRASVGGPLFLRLHAGVPTSTPAYAQVEYRDVKVEAVDGPVEPG